MPEEQMDLPYTRKKSPVDCAQSPSRTKQSLREDSDINTIVNKFQRTGRWDNVNPRPARFGDFSGPRDLTAALDLVNTATDEFNELPAEIRRAADYDVVKFHEMLTTEEGVAELMAVGQPVEIEEVSEPAQPAIAEPEATNT